MPKKLPIKKPIKKYKVALLSLMVIVVVAGVSTYVLHRNNPCNRVPKNGNNDGMYAVPCEIMVTMSQRGQVLNEAEQRSALTTLLVDYDATIQKDSLPSVGIYYVNVASGKEDMLVRYLRQQKGIVSGAERQFNCVEKCPLELGPAI